VVLARLIEWFLVSFVYF